jgi:hypothetical protein
MVFPPHSTHSLQLLDVVLYALHLRHYTEELTHYLQQTQGLTKLTKRDFYSNFWPAWNSTMTLELILKSFQATDMWPVDADAVLNALTTTHNNKMKTQKLESMATAIAGLCCAKFSMLQLLTRPELKLSGCRKAYPCYRSTTSFFALKTRSYNTSSTLSRSTQRSGQH